MNRTIPKFIIFCLLLVILSVTIFPADILAQSKPFEKPPLKDLKFNEVIKILNKLVTWIFTIFLIVAVIIIIFAAFTFVVSGSNPTGVKKATHMLVYAAVAIAVALFSISIRYLVEQLVLDKSSATPKIETPCPDPNKPC